MANRQHSTVEEIMADPACSNWLKTTLQGALRRDPVDALTDAELLTSLLRSRLDDLLHASARKG